MAKKKGKNGKQDARGYSTSVSTTKTNAPATTAKTHGNLQSLLNQATDESSSSAQKTEASALLLSQLDTTSKRFYRKIENLHDQLIRCRFSEEQIDIVVRELGNSPTNSPTDSDTTATTSDLYTVESALDWLCLNLPAEELPALFTEHNVREALSQTTTSVEVIQPTPQQFQSGSNEIRFDESSNQHLLFESSDNSKETEDHDADDEAKKAWILNQYQYEEEEDDDAVNADEKADDTPFQPRVEVMLSPLELRLQTLETEIKELHSEVNDEASNYMRSKYEIKEMKKELSKLQGQAKKLRGQVAKSKVVAEQVPQVAKLVVVEEKKELEGGEDAMDEDMGGCFGMFNEPNEDHVPQKPPETKEPPAVEVEEYDPLRLRSSTPSIPKEWTGTTPKDQLEVWCKKRKVARPTFTKLPHTSNGCRMKIKTKPDVCLEEKGPFYDFVDAQQFLATRALYQMSSELPMYRMFPPVFRDLWKSWLGRVEEAKSIQKQENRQAKDERIRELIELIPKQLRIGDVAEDAKDELVVDMTTQPLELDDWEGAETTEIEPSQSQSRLGRELMAEFSRRRGTSAFKAMEEIRQSLPMYTFRSELLQCVANNAVTVLCAETGAGKTTQGPQFMLEEALKSGKGDKTSIICTQPRRISAMSVAERVADEMCVKLGDLIGYQIRGEVKKSQRTKLLFCTTGVVLRRLQDDPSLSGVTTVVVDEVHERSWQIDFLLIALRRLLQTSRPDLKVVLMSATLDSDLFCSFFGGAPLVNVPGRTFPVAHYFLEDLLDATDHTIEEDSIFTLRDTRKHRNTEALWITTQGGEKRREVVEMESQTDCSQVSGHYPGYKKTTQRSMDRVDEKVINYDLIEDVLVLLSTADNDRVLTPSGSTPADGAVLVFLPGMGEIRSLTNRLTGSRVFGNKSKFEIIPLHSSLSPQDQKRAFATPRRGCRKIILATNIAETSVTIPDVVSVIDCGLVREVRQDKRYATSKLVLDWCSKASIKQRAGRAGRVKEGICCRLFSSRTAKLFMKDQTMPELQRVPLEEVCLSILAGNLSNSCTDFLMQAPQPPPLDSVALAIRLLNEVGVVQVIDNRETLTALGQHVAKIPVHVRLAKMLIFGAVFKCLDPVLTIVGSLSGKSPFAAAMHDAAQTAAAHQKFRHESSDFLGFVQLWEAYRIEVEKSKDQGRAFCRRNFLNWTVMMEIRDLRRQNLELLCQIGFVQGKVKEHDVAKSVYNMNGTNKTVVHAVVCAGLYPNIAHAIKEHIDDPPVLWHKKERLYFHSASVNHKKKKLLSEWLVFHEKFATGRTTVSTTSPIHPLTLILFGGDVVVKHLERKVLVDEWIELDLAAQTGVMFRELRRKLDVLLLSLVEKADSRSGDDMVDGIVKLITN